MDLDLWFDWPVKVHLSWIGLISWGASPGCGLETRFACHITIWCSVAAYNWNSGLLFFEQAHWSEGPIYEAIYGSSKQLGFRALLLFDKIMKINDFAEESACTKIQQKSWIWSWIRAKNHWFFLILSCIDSFLSPSPLELRKKIQYMGQSESRAPFENNNYKLQLKCNCSENNSNMMCLRGPGRVHHPNKRSNVRFCMNTEEENMWERYRCCYLRRDIGRLWGNPHSGP